MNSSTLDSYCVVGIITRELPLSARAIMASFSFSLVFMFLMVLVSWPVLCVWVFCNSGGC
jgi:ammonia channel protein AmtB